MAILLSMAASLFLLWFIHGLIEWRRDVKFRASTRGALYSDEWRKVPPPNWASRRGTQDYW